MNGLGQLNDEILGLLRRVGADLGPQLKDQAAKVVVCYCRSYQFDRILLFRISLKLNTVLINFIKVKVFGLTDVVDECDPVLPLPLVKEQSGQD